MTIVNNDTKVENNTLTEAQIQKVVQQAQKACHDIYRQVTYTQHGQSHSE